MQSLNVAIRTDASPHIGAGHLMRCLALAQALQDKGARVRFVCRNLPAPYRSRVRDAGHEIAEVQGDESEDAMRALSDRSWDWVAVDHYELDARWESTLRRCGAKILVIDDLANRTHDCDLLVDQNLREDGGAAYDDLLPGGCEKLLGPRFALIDGSFAAARAGLQARPRDGVLVSFGGSDPRSLTMPVLRALLRTLSQECRIDVAVGAMHRDLEALRALAADNANVRVHPDTRDMAELMAQSRLFVGAGGGTSWQRCCVALPGIVVSAAANQVGPCLALHDAGSHVYLGNASEVSSDAVAQAAVAVLGSPAWWSRLAERSSSIVDGLGAGRVAERLRIGEVRLREACAQDEETVLAWRNDPAVRRYSGSSQEITRGEHSKWFARALAEANCHLLIGYDARGESGVLRYDVDSHRATVSLYLVPSRLGRGAGAALLVAGERWLRARRPEIHVISAQVHAGNRASVRLFERAGYRVQKHDYVRTLVEKGTP